MELADLVVAGRLLGDDVQPVHRVHERDQQHEGRELLLVVVLDGTRPHLVADPGGRVRDPGPCSASASAARSASVKTVASRQAAIKFSRTGLSPSAAASLVCMSMQTAQPLIWLTRSATSSCVAAGSGDSFSSRPADMKYLRALPAVELAGQEFDPSLARWAHPACTGARGDRW